MGRGLGDSIVQYGKTEECRNLRSSEWQQVMEGWRGRRTEEGGWLTEPEYFLCSFCMIAYVSFSARVIFWGCDDEGNLYSYQKIRKYENTER
jgi:hypothetical protein